ncbi:hypothetical protein [Streptomyces cahuitamycinicus]|nr:hypothetical protein [Streptomyces cahuitamycinicus]
MPPSEGYCPDPAALCSARLADYAQVITAGLPELRAAHSYQGGNGS